MADNAAAPPANDPALDTNDTRPAVLIIGGLGMDQALQEM